ncbi:MAG TPA: dynamin family protein [Hyphomicrobiales bacterium]|jgi:GTP-binding protein EngB required for normal cell division
MQNSLIAILGTHLRNFWGKGAMTPPLQASMGDAFGQAGWTNIYRTRETSILFRSVLAETGGEPETNTELPKRPDADMPAAKPAAPSKVKIGEQLQARSDLVRRQGEALVALADPRIAEYIRAALGNLNRQFCRVAFVGQMNSGKSSLVNVLTQRPDFLPTDINPWTTVVTNLHFGAPLAPKSGAVFKFFNWDEWRRLAEGSPRIKELTRRLMPDFDWNSFADQVNAIRGRAQDRLGARFDELTGQTHQFHEVTTELLEQYICAGSPYDEAGDAAKAGEYSSITKIADIYFDLECFNFPTTLVDTPGVNDPFLVRDEITRQNLEIADIYVVVLTARQPLSQADLNLLRLLRGLNKERIVVFVNKIDEVEAFEDYATEIQSRIKELLAKELNFIDVPIVLGSAFWARAALAGDAKELAEQLEASQSIGGSTAIALDAGESFWLDDASGREVKTEALLTRSGTPALAAALSDMMQSGPIPRIIEGVGTLLRTIAKNAGSIDSENARLISRLLDGSRAGGESGAEGVRLLRDRSGVIGRVGAEVEARIGKLESEIRGLIEESVGKLHADLTQRVAIFSKAQGADFLQRQKQSARPTWRCNTLPLRSELEAVLSLTLGELQAKLGDLQERAALDLQAIAEQAAADLGATIEAGPLPFRSLSPSLAPLSEMVAVDPDSPVWSQWWSKRMSADARATHLRKVIETEFAAIIDKLVASAEREAGELTAALLSHFRIVMLAPLESWRDRLKVLIEVTGGEDAAIALERQLAGNRMRQDRYNAVMTALQSGAI